MRKTSNKKFILIIISFLFYISLTTITYSIFSSILNVQGTIKTIEMSSSPNVLPGNFILEQSDGRHFVFGSPELISTLRFVSESWEGDNYTIRFRKTGIRLVTRTNTFTIFYRNDSVLPWTDGSVFTSTPKNYSYIRGHSATMDKTRVEANGDVVKIVISIDARWELATDTQEVHCNVNYIVDGIPRTIVIKVIYGPLI